MMYKEVKGDLISLAFKGAFDAIAHGDYNSYLKPDKMYK